VRRRAEGLGDEGFVDGDRRGRSVRRRAAGLGDAGGGLAEQGREVALGSSITSKRSRRAAGIGARVLAVAMKSTRERSKGTSR